MNHAAAIYVGSVMHHRFRPFRHRFVYRAFTCLFDLDRLEEATRASRLFRLNRRGLVAFWNRDHGRRDGTPLRPWVDKRLAQAGLPRAHRIDLLCLPRILGFVFNPLSIYFCRDDAGTLFAVLYEVKNTFGGQHVYLCPVRDDRLPLRQRAAKAFHVSPFIGMEAEYRFTVQPPDRTVSIAIDEWVPEGRQLIALQRGERRPFTDRVWAGLLLAMPFITFKIVAAIHWQALQLWLKGAKFRREPAKQPGEHITLGSD
jgi:hypothetical protein